MSLLAHNYTPNVAIITLSSLTHHNHPDCAVTRHPLVTKTGSNCDTDRQTLREESLVLLSLHSDPHSFVSFLNNWEIKFEFREKNLVSL